MQSDGTEIGAPPPTEHGTADSDHEGAGEHVHLPAQSIWPVTTAFGTAVAGFGLVTTFAVSLLGLGIMAWGLISWIQEIRHELH